MSKELNPTESTELDEILAELGFANKPGSAKGRMYSQRYYVSELKQALVAWHKSECRKMLLRLGKESVVEFYRDRGGLECVVIPRPVIAAEMERLK
jgi:hypothetical protein